jgi:N-acetylmuramoyl-L-alanine amidase
MSDDPRLPHDPDFDDSQAEPDIPASLAFMEMMRQQAAAKAVPPPTPARSVTDQAASIPTGNVNELTAVQREQAMEEQRILRVKRRRARRRRQTVGVLGGILRTLIVVVVAAGLTATIFTWWTPSRFISQDVQTGLSVALATSQVTLVPTGLPTPNWLRKVGIVSGHRGPEGDPGAVCDDGLSEAEVNFAVAQLVVRNLRGRGYSVDLLDEFDPRLDNYQAAALVSIHANTCQDFGEVVSGFLIAAAAARVTARGNDEILVNCVAQFYGQATGLQRRDGVTVDMTDYHTFREIHPVTPAAIIELGFMLADRPILTGQQEEMAQAITEGVLCFLEPANPAAAPPAG